MQEFSFARHIFPPICTILEENSVKDLEVPTQERMQLLALLMHRQQLLSEVTFGQIEVWEEALFENL